ncbi:hypothetical protein CHLRE_07g321200v5 [Chlamydomonas reinhardtii]|uniref:SET domain-containing protein n=1 Tax=Chlamydomonas reinhardtii TaxID=3055 RepID=A0A2K3DJ25_CHLRE|nr:uncharacterized protein CHLRE_07g321200v5 [Chlamydomonas reinhardtii]PNW80530.1 hypothetical protein CHLRE_07g321200v5 [Chlamydomonas reinhardtii]
MVVGLGFRAAARDNPAIIYQILRALSSASASTVAPGTGVAAALRAATVADAGTPKAEGRALPRWLPAAAMAAAAAAATMVAAGGLVVSGDAPPGPAADASGQSNQAAAARELEDWLKAQGADVSKVQIKPSQAGPGAGLGLFATAAVSAQRHGASWWSWLWPRRGGAAGQREPTTLAAFPLAAAITARKACQDPQLGEQFSWMLDRQLLDERTAVMVYLLVERLRGDKSAYAPWIRALPQSFDAPINFAAADLSELRGTTLAKAVEAVSRRMRDTWSRLESPLAALCRDLGLRRPTWDDWVWAYCVWWSRGQSLPVPESGSATKALASLSAASNGHGHGNGASGNGNGGGAGLAAGAVRKVNIEVVEGLVPGLDFANHRHSPPPQCWWEVVAPERPTGKDATGSTGSASASATPSSASTSASSNATMVRLQLHAGTRVRPGEELFISYGDKSNEELLMLYGFAAPGNPHEFLMLYCPIPPQAEWDDVMHARMELLQSYGLRPQFFLPHPDSVSGPSEDGTAGSGAKRGGKKPAGGKAAADSGSGAGAGVQGDAAAEAAAAAAAPPLVLPGDVLDTLEVFVLNFQELAHRSRALQTQTEDRRAARAAGSPLAAVAQHSPVLELAALRSRLPRMAAAELKHYLASLGLRMATLTAFIRLLEIKVLELEGAEGTGSLEQDEQLLARLDAQAAASLAEDAPGKLVYPPAPKQQQQHKEREHERTRRLRAALVYRMGQKQLARAWLVRAKAELTNLLALMRDMETRCSSLERAKK